MLNMAARDQRTIDTLADIICRHARLKGLSLADNQRERVAAEMYIYILNHDTTIDEMIAKIEELISKAGASVPDCRKL